MTHCLSHCTLLISPGINVTNVTMNGSRLDDLGDWESLVLHVRYQSPELSMLPMWSPVLSPCIWPCFTDSLYMGPGQQLSWTRPWHPAMGLSRVVNELNCWFSIGSDIECFHPSSIDNEETMLMTGEKIRWLRQTVACHYAEVTSVFATVPWLTPSQFKLSLGGENSIELYWTRHGR